MTPEQMAEEIQLLRAELAEERSERRKATETLRLMVEAQAKRDAAEADRKLECFPRVTLKAPPEIVPERPFEIRLLTDEERAEKEREWSEAQTRRRAEAEKRRLEEEAAKRAASRVYFIRQDMPDGLVKIGFTRRPVEKRLAELQKHHACALVVAAVAPGLMSEERHLHDRFSHLRVSGEWFRQDADLTAYIQLVSDRGAL